MNQDASTPSRPVPITDPATAPFWKAASQGELSLPRCGGCQRVHYYPRAVCPHCGSEDLAWETLSGRGTIYSWTVSRRPAGASFKPYVPYVVALIDLDEGARMLSNVRTDDVDGVAIGQAVQVDFEEMAEDIALPVFRPA